MLNMLLGDQVKRRLYDLYTHLGFEYKKRGEYATYAYKANK